MGRPGVTYTEVSAAASHLLGEGKNPTVEQVRLLLGSGSSTTIANHLRQWKQDQQGSALFAAKENIPPALVEMIKGLWERMMDLSQDKLNEAERAFETTLSEQSHDLQKYKTNNQRWQQLFNQWRQEKDALTADIQTLNAGVSDLNQTIAKQESVIALKTQQCLEKDERITELHKLHKQTQANLEHFRDAAKEQREKEHLQFDQERQTWLLENKKLIEMHNQSKLNFQELDIKHQNTEIKLAEMSEKWRHAEAERQTKTDLLTALTAEHETKLQQHAQVSKQLSETQTQLDNKTIKFIDAESTVKFLSQQAEEFKKQIRDFQDQIKLLAHDKWVISQEYANAKAQLEKIGRA